MRQSYRVSTLLLSSAFVLMGCSSTEPQSKLPAPITLSQENYSPDAKLPIDPKVIKGTLDNGLTYIIRKNAKPKQRAELRLVVKAGSLLEDESQQGFAHFVEHMAFNGTEDFKKQEIVNYIESLGMRFGSHLNASTSFETTIYKLQLPTQKAEVLETGIHILENWAHKVSFEPEEIDKERGVILEEWRSKQGSRNRIRNKQIDTLFKDSQYAIRLPIGQKEVIETGSHQELVRFYREWYRPDLMTVIAVGDFEPKQVQHLIEKYFNQIAKPLSPKAKPKYPLPDNSEPLISIETDPELTLTRLQLWVKHPYLQPQTYREEKLQQTRYAYISLLNTRLYELSNQASSPVISARASYKRSIGRKNLFSLSATVKSGQTLQALKALLAEVNRTVQHGFLPAEFNRVKQASLSSLAKVYKERGSLKSARFANEYIRHTLNAEAIPGIENEYVLRTFLTENTSLQELNQVSKGLLTKENRVISVTAPESERQQLPSADALLAAWTEALSEQVTAYQEEPTATELMSSLPSPGSITTKQYDQQLSAHIWTLSNGATVLLKPTQFKKDEILFRAVSPGGFSLVDDATYYKTKVGTSFIRHSGVATMSSDSLRRFKKGKQFSLASSVNTTSESLSGKSTSKDLHYLMQLLHLKFTAMRRDPEKFNTLKAKQEAYLLNRKNSPQQHFSEAIRQATRSHDPRSTSYDATLIQAQDFESSLQLYQQRFSNAADFTFTFVGNLDLNQMETLISQYIASLPANGSREMWKKYPCPRTRGDLNVHVKKGLEPKATVQLRFSGDAHWSHKESVLFAAMRENLKTRLREQLREEKSGVYSVRVSGGLSHLSHEEFGLGITFICDPKRIDELVAEVHRIIAELQAAPLEGKYIDNYKKMRSKQYKSDLKTNSFWLSYLSWSQHSERKAIPIETYQSLLQSLDSAQIQQTAIKYLSNPDTLFATLTPEQTAD